MLKRIGLAAGAVFLLTSAQDPAHADGHCALPGISFASCAPPAHHFRSVVVAIPGWRGSCATTFGKGTNNLLNVMRRSNFFDVDCFDYDSDHSTLEKSRSHLRARLEQLHKSGYREFAFLTHSTGGVLALDLILHEALERGGNSFIFSSDTGLRLRALFSWAIPLNGTRDLVTAAGAIINIFGASPEVLPLLAADSDYLAGLKKKLMQVDGTKPDASGRGFQWVIFQGQNDDGVVRNIEPSAAWLPKFLPYRLVLTESGHSHNVSAGGEVGAPHYPGEIMADKALLAFGLHPRTDLYFSPSAKPSEDLYRKQRVVLRGILDFAASPQLFQPSYKAVSEFIVRLFNGRFHRDTKFDHEAVQGLSALLAAARVRDLDRDYAVQFGDRLLNDIQLKVDQDQHPPAEHFGGGSQVAIRLLAKTVDDVFLMVTDLIGKYPQLEHELLSSGGSLTTFQARATAVLARFLRANDDQTQRIAVSALSNVAARADEQAIADSKLMEQLAAYSQRSYRVLPQERKQELANVFTTLHGRSSELSVQTLAVLSQNVDWFAGQSAPLWATLMGNDQVGRLVEASVPQAPTGSQQAKFLGQVIGRAGADGRSVGTAQEAVKAYEGFIQNAPSAVVERNVEIMREAARQSNYPAVRREIGRTLERSGFSAER